MGDRAPTKISIGSLVVDLNIDENAWQKGDAINALALGMFDCAATRHVSIDTPGHEALLQSSLGGESI